MSFCGSRQGSLSVKDGVVRNKCFVDVMNIIPHGLFIIVSITILIAWRQSIMGKLKAKTWVHFQCHSLRWILTLLLILITCLEIAEGFVSDYIDPDRANYHVIVPPCVALVSSVLTIVLYHNIEMWNSPRFLLIMLPYWFSCCGLKLLKAFSLYATDIEAAHLRLWVTWSVVIMYAALFVVEIFVLLVQRYAFFKKCHKVHPPAELANTRYYATFANFLSRATFWWMNSVLIEGYKTVLTSEHLGKLPSCEKALSNYKLLLHAFDEEKENAARKNKEPSLHKTYLKAFWPMLLLAGVFRLFGDLLAFVGPWCIESIVDYAYAELEQGQPQGSPNNATSGTSDAFTYTAVAGANLSITNNVTHKETYVTVVQFCSNGYGLCVVLFVATVIQHTLLQNHHYMVIRQGVRLRSALQTMIYSKALRLSSLNITNRKTTVGQIMNHMTMDTNFLMMLFFFIHYLWATPLQVVIALVLMYFKLGISAVIGGLLIVLTAPLQVFVGKGMSRMQKKVMAQADKRVKQCNEMVHGIKVIKLLAWEGFISRNINAARSQELKCLLINAIFRAMFTFIGTAVPALATLLTFILYPYIEGKSFTAGQALSTLALFNILTVPLILFSLFTSSLIMANVSAKRLVPYLTFEEVEGLQSPTDTMQTTTGSLGGDPADMENIQLNMLSPKDKSTSASMCSLASHHSHSVHMYHQSRQHSTASLFDFQPDHGVSAAALSHGNDHQGARRRNPSGLSGEEEEEPIVVEVEQGNFSWELDSKELTLKSLSFQIATGKLAIVVGPVGSGKTSLVSALLGEMLTVTGKVAWCRNASIAYVAQKPWILNKSLKDNILFGSPFIWKRYQKVIEACALQQDIDSLPAGDLTEVGEKGVNLSGGQKQRISIARALYSSAETFILDDPMSALDAHVGRHVFDEVILKRLLRRKKTVILVTHQLQYLSYAYKVLVMKEGGIEYQGKLSEVKKTHPELYESWRKALKEAKTAETSSRNESVVQSDGTIDHLPAHLPARQTSITSQMSIEEVVTKETNGKISTVSAPVFTCVESTKVDEGTDPKDEDDDFEKEEELTKAPAKPGTGALIQKEHRETGSVRYQVYLTYLRSCGLPLVVIVFLLLMVNQTLLVSNNIWIANWSSKATIFTKAQQGTNSTQSFDNSPYIHVYLVLSLGAIFVTLMSVCLLQMTGIRGSRRLHCEMLSTILRVPMRFFDTNPSGRIINRFSADIGQIDQKIPATIDAFLRCALATLAAVVVNCVGTPYFILAVIPIAILYMCMQKFYTATARELQRLDSVTKSPIFSHFGETLNGLQTIRAYKAQARFKQLALHTIDSNVVPFLFNQTANRWLGIRLDYMGGILVFTAAIASLSAGLAGHTDPAYIGLCIAYALMVSNYLNWIVRNSAELEMLMNAVERVDEYTKLSTETTLIEEYTKEAGWPSQGKIEFHQVSLSYDIKQDPVVTNVSFIINSGEKIGICGRTGSGKSSLTLSLFRMIEISEGQILIDGRNISHIALPALRSKLAIIPQDPILFTGTIRYNLDPAGEIEDERLWNALESVQLKDFIEALPEKLDASVSEGGENFSIGQKQLFCLARAFLRDNKILVLDEATASIDLETDNKLQLVIGTVFKEKTIITIAHRVSTIMKYDRVMTMESGRMIEFDSPQILMQKEDSYFYQLVKQSYK